MASFVKGGDKISLIPESDHHDKLCEERFTIRFHLFQSQIIMVRDVQEKLLQFLTKCVGLV